MSTLSLLPVRTSATDERPTNLMRLASFRFSTLSLCTISSAKLVLKGSSSLSSYMGSSGITESLISPLVIASTKPVLKASSSSERSSSSSGISTSPRSLSSASFLSCSSSGSTPSATTLWAASPSSSSSCYNKSHIN